MHSVQILATITTFLATASLAYPKHDSNAPTVEDAQNQCGKDQTLACCNSDNYGVQDGGSLLGSIGLNQLLGGNCQTITVPVFGVPINSPQACGSNIAACCQKNDQTGAINVNVQCSPIDVL